jgi:hypothetical protein
MRALPRTCLPGDLVVKAEGNLRDSQLPRPVVYKQHLNISLCRNSGPDDWTLEINGDVHRHIPSDVVEAITEGTLIQLISLLENDENPSWLTMANIDTCA